MCDHRLHDGIYLLFLIVWWETSGKTVFHLPHAPDQYPELSLVLSPATNMGKASSKHIGLSTLGFTTASTKKRENPEGGYILSGCVNSQFQESEESLWHSRIALLDPQTRLRRGGST